jgi:hypothetical protein
MKNSILKLTVGLFLCFGGLNAQSFQRGQMDLDMGVGLGNTYIGPGYSNSTPPLNVSFNYGITNDISLGGYLGFSQATYTYAGWDDCGQGHGNGQYYVDTYKWTYIIAGVQGDFHFGRFIKIDKLDVYAGLLLGNDFAHSAYFTTSVCPDHIAYLEPTYGGFVAAPHVGARYRFTDHFGVFLELGYGITYVNTGLNFKF